MPGGKKGDRQHSDRGEAENDYRPRARISDLVSRLSQSKLDTDNA